MINADSSSDRTNFRGSNKDLQSETSADVKVQGQRKDLNTIFPKLRIADSTGLSLSHMVIPLSAFSSQFFLLSSQENISFISIRNFFFLLKTERLPLGTSPEISLIRTAICMYHVKM